MNTSTNVVRLRQPEELEDPLTEVLRSGARRLLAQAVELEAETFLAGMQDFKLPDGRDRLVRHGYGPERMIQTGIGPVAVSRVKIRDRGAAIRKYIERGLEPPVYGSRQVGRPNKLVPFIDYLRERVTAFPDLSAVRLTRELRERGYVGAYTAVKRHVAAIRPVNGPKPFEVRFE